MENMFEKGSRLCAFQLRLLYRIHQQNVEYLVHTISPWKCCFEDTESTDHLSWYCPQVACFWSQVQKWLKINSIDLKLTLEIVLLGDHLLLVKVFIFNSQSVDSIRLDRLKLYVKHHSIVERYVLRRNPKWVASRDRWDGLREAEG